MKNVSGNTSNGVELTDLSVGELAKGYRAKEFSPVDVVRAYLGRIEREDPELHAYLEVFHDAEMMAKGAEGLFASDPEGSARRPFLGIPVAVKDNILIKGKLSSAGSKMLQNHIAAYDATAIARLKEAGAVFLGRTNMDEFAFGSSTEKSAYGPTKNPYDLSRVPGGTSGGSAVAVAARMAPIALGSDTGGSIRQPASFCNVLGLKTTYGAVSRSGLIAAASSFDQIGGLARSTRDLETLFGVIAGHDPKDGTTLPDSVRTKKGFEHEKTIGVPRKFLSAGVDPKILERFEATLATLSEKGYRVVDIEIPNIDYALSAYYILIFAEEATNLSRFDGMRYGLHKEGKNLADEYKKSRSAGFGWEVKRRIILGNYILSHGYYDAYYRRATALRGLLVKDFDAAFSAVDAIAMPTSPVLPFKFGEKDADPLAMYLADIFTVPINVAGVPAISVPAGFAEHEGAKLPVGVQFVAQKLSEDKLFAIARDVLGEP